MRSPAQPGRNRSYDARASRGNPSSGTSLLPLLVARAREVRPVDGPEWIAVGDAAQISGMSRFFFYDHWKELPFCRKIGRSVKINSRGLRQWLETKRAA